MESVHTRPTQLPETQTKQQHFDLYRQATGKQKVVKNTNKTKLLPKCFDFVSKMLGNIELLFCFSFVGLVWTRHYFIKIFWNGKHDDIISFLYIVLRIFVLSIKYSFIFPRFFFNKMYQVIVARSIDISLEFATDLPR